MRSTKFTSSYRSYAEEVKQFAKKIGFLLDWSDYRCFFLEHLEVDEAWRISLPLMSCVASGGAHEKALPVAVSWAILKQAAYLLDDVIDDDTYRSQIDSKHQALGYFAAANFAAFYLLGNIEPPIIGQREVVLFSEAGFTSSIGMNLGFTRSANRDSLEQSLELYWHSVILKSGGIYRAVTAGGAVAAGAPDGWVKALGEYGNALGVIQQVIDDCRDFQDDKQVSMEMTLPGLIYAMRVPDGMKGQKPFAEILQNPDQNKIQFLNEADVPEIISNILMEWRQRALNSLEQLPRSFERNALVNNLDLILKQ